MKKHHCWVLLLFLGFVFFESCNSVKRYNAKISQKHSVSDLREDVDIAYTQLKKFQPQLYQYISKEALDNSFDSLKQSIKEPMDSKSFAYALTKVINKVGQAHNTVEVPSKRYTKKERKERDKYTSDFHKFFLSNVGDTVYVRRDITEDNQFLHAQVMAIEGEKVEDIIEREMPYITSDGYNQTFRPKIVAYALKSYWQKRTNKEDSIQVTFQKNDSIWVHEFTKELKSEKNSKKIKDSIHEDLKDLNTPKKKLTKKEKKEKDKQKRENRKKFGYNYTTKENQRSFEFIGKEKNIPYIKIKTFSKSGFTSFYKEVFEKIDSADSDYLILDIRDNLGGRLDDIHELYSYLSQEEFQFINDSEVTKRGSMYRTMMSSRVPNAYKVILGLISPIFYPVTYFRSYKADNGKLYYPLSGSKNKEPKNNAFQGKIYVITNGMSFSASSILATALDQNPEVIFVGEEAGGDYNGTVAGNFKYKTLPHSKVDIRLGVFYLDALPKSETVGRGILPDKAIKSSYQDILEGRDREIEWILEDIDLQEREIDN